MPRASDEDTKAQLAKPLIIGEGKCGKTDWAARAAECGFNVLYLNGDIAAQTIAGLPKAARERIFILDVRDKWGKGGIGTEMIEFFDEFVLATQPIRWNDTQSRLYDRVLDGAETPDEIWEIRPWNLDENWVVVTDSWTSLSQSAMRWVAARMKIDLGDIDKDERGKMRSEVYQPAGEKLTSQLTVIRSAKCHWIVIGHPSEYEKKEKPAGSKVNVQEKEMKVLWTKHVPKSSSNNHSLTMAKNFTDIGWLEVDAMGDYMIDWRAKENRISGSHQKTREPSRGKGSFGDLVKILGGKFPDGPVDFTPVITIHKGYTVQGAKPKEPAIVLGDSKADGTPTEAQPALKGKALNLAGLLAQQTKK